MPVTVGINAALGAALAKAGAVKIGALTLSAWQGALLFGGLAAAQFLLRPQLSSPNLQGTRTQSTVRSAAEPARWVFGRQRIGGVVVHASEQTERVPRTPPPPPESDHTNRTDYDEFQCFSFVLHLAEHPIEEIERLWINGIEVPVRYGTPRTGPNGSIVPLEDQTARTPDCPIIPPADGPWGIGLGNGIGDYDFPNTEDGKSDRLDRSTRNKWWVRWPYIVWPRISGAGKPRWAGARFPGSGWWDAEKEDIQPGDGQKAGPEGHSYLVVDLYQPFQRSVPSGSGRDGHGPDEHIEGSGAGYPWRSPIPDVEVQVKGMRIGVPVDGDGNEGDPEWTENAASVAWWFVTRRLGLPLQALDVPAWRAAIAVCAEEIADQGSEDDDPRDVDVAGRIGRYGADGTVLSGDPAGEVLRELAQAMDGAVTTGGGQLAVRPGQLRPVSHDVPSSDVIAVTGVEVQPPTSARANVCHMRLRQSDLHGWQAHEMAEVWNESGQRNDGTRLETDTGERAYVASPVRARALMRAELMRIRDAANLRMAPVYTVHITTGPDDEHLEIRELERITLSYPPLGLDSLEVEVLSIRIEPDWTLTLVARANGNVAPFVAPVYCPGFGDAPPEVLSAAVGQVGVLYAAPSSLVPTEREGDA